jgi:hypothetical protein
MDYGIALKCDSFRMASNLLLSMLKVFLLLHSGRSNRYIQSICMHIMQMCHQKMHKLPAWTMVKESISMFVEEAG